MPLSNYRARVRAKHKSAYDLYDEIAPRLEDSILTPRVLASAADKSIDMLFVQAHKAYMATALLTQYGLMEDSATLSRRLMELAVQSVYIGGESDEKVREKRGGMYLAHMWRQLGRKRHDSLPPHIRSMWSGFARRYGRYVPKKAKMWGPNWKDMFTAIGAADLYDDDYSFLSGIAHGRSDHQIILYSKTKVNLNDDAFVSVLVIYSTRYYLMAAGQWNERFKVVDTATFEAFVKKATSARVPTP
jgi:hypothetical protein